jgi:catechol 2,3-dioxygenase-like lactoylglutathione lyase family enzyme
MSETPPVLNQVNLVVEDMDATLRFYRRLGLEIPDTDPAWARHHRSAVMPGGIDLDFDSVEFVRQWDEGWPGPGGAGTSGGATGVLGFALPTRAAVDARYSDLTEAGYTPQQPPYDAFWGARYAVVEDPDGNAVGLMSPPDADHRRDATPPAGGLGR